MAWSTRRLAYLAGTSVRAVRHYHEVGLMPEPPRAANGYKQYAVGDLVRLLRIKRLCELGLSLPQVGEVLDVNQVPAEALQGLDQELARSVEQLQQVRHEIAALLQAPTLSVELPAQLSALAGVPMTDADRAFMAVLARVLAPSAVETYVEVVLRCAGDPVMAAFEELSPDAPDAERADLAGRLAASLRRHGAGPGHDEELLSGLAAHRRHAATAQVTTALRELFTPAQVDVLARLSAVLHAGHPDTGPPGTGPPGTGPPGTGPPGTARPGTARPGTARPGTARPGTSNSGGASSPAPPGATPSAG